MDAKPGPIEAPRGNATQEATHERLERMVGVADQLAAALEGHEPEAVSARPAPDAWSATEILCHLRDIEDFYMGRMRLMLVNDHPTLVVLDPDRWARERQYQRNDAREALATFRAGRCETLVFLHELTEEQWERSAIHPLLGVITVRRIVHSMAKHDQVHLAQLERALVGQA
jgi:uncharacterized damage-inducible protein DinB